MENRTKIKNVIQSNFKILNWKEQKEQKEKEHTLSSESITFFQSTSNTFLLMIKTHFKGSSFYISNLLIPIIVTLGIVSFMTLTYGIIWILFLTLTFAGLSTYGTIFFTIRKSTLIKNISMTSNETGTLYFATFWLILSSITITFFVVILTCIFFDKIGLVMHQLAFNNDNPIGIWYTNYSAISWAMLFNYLFTQAIICFSLSFVIEQVFGTQKNFFIFSMVYVVAGIFFSGMFSSTLYISKNNVVDVVSNDTTIEDLQGIAVIKTYMWGNTLWKVGQLFPHFGLNQMAGQSFSVGAYHYDSAGEIIWNKWHYINVFTDIGTPKVLWYILSPWLWTLLLISLGSTLERYNKH